MHENIFDHFSWSILFFSFIIVGMKFEILMLVFWFSVSPYFIFIDNVFYWEIISSFLHSLFLFPSS